MNLRLRLEMMKDKSVDVALSQGEETFYIDLVNLKADVDNLIFEVFHADEHGLTEEEVLCLLDYQAKLSIKKAELEGVGQIKH